VTDLRASLGQVELRGRLMSAIVSALAFAVLSVLVATGATQDLDETVRQVFRPDDIWSTNQLIFGNVVDGLGPPVAAGILLLSGLVAVWRRRSPGPLIYVGVLGVCAVVLTGVAKLCVHRPDPHGGLSTLGGAYPSGHMVLLLVSLGGAILVLRARSRWWDWLLVTVLEVLMGISLLFLAMHWFTDVVGGALLGVAIVAPASLVRPRWEDVGRTRRAEPGRSRDLI
jgi:membrane-associated phospholipid phosphatase